MQTHKQVSWALTKRSEGRLLDRVGSEQIIFAVPVKGDEKRKQWHQPSAAGEWQGRAG